jgi:glucokinase
MQKILAVDVGGTKIAVAWAHPGDLRLEAVASYPTGQQASLKACLEAYLRAHPGEIMATGIGIAGPVFGRRCEGTNLPWAVDAAALEDGGGLGPVAMVNDFHAATLGVLHLPPGAWLELNPHAASPDPAAPWRCWGRAPAWGPPWRCLAPTAT